MAKTEIEQLIEQAEGVLKKYPKRKPQGTVSTRTWQEILDGKPYLRLRVERL